MDLLVFDLGMAGYEEVYSLQKMLVTRIAASTFPQSLLLLEHFPVYTMGISGSDKNMLKNIPVVHVDRGGDITYHGPGQLVGYPILRLGERRVSRYVRTLEESLIYLLKVHSIDGSIKERFPGVWVGEEKIASIGVRVREGVTYHGFALNVNVDLQAFHAIHPCGLTVEMTSMEKVLSKPVCVKDVKESYVKAFERVFGLRTKEGDPYLLHSCTS